MQAMTSEVLSGTPCWRRVSEIADLAEIFEPGVQVCSWHRTIDPRIATYLDGADGGGSVQSIETLASGERARLDGLPAGDNREVLLDDVALLCEILHELLDCPLAGLRCTRVSRALCPGWHIDRVPLRMLCTYQGPGTEWLDDQGVDRTRLGSTEVANGGYQRAEAGEVVLLKGGLWQDNDDLGAVHRSPAVAPGAGWRTLTSLDPLWSS